VYHQKDRTMTLVGWDVVQVGENGMLVLDNDMNTVHFVAIGERTGEVMTYQDGAFNGHNTIIR
jgi:hypothetical protein